MIEVPITYRSVYNTQDDVLQAIRALHCPDGFECDMTYGNGAFWHVVQRPTICMDLTPLGDGVVQADCTKLPFESGTRRNLVFDPPFLTYIRNGREHNSIMGKRFSGYWSYGELTEHYQASISEARRVLRKYGILVFKCQDIIHNHKMHCTHANIICWANARGFRLRDLFVLARSTKMPVQAAPHGIQKQKHARIFHSYFLVLEAV